jgi:GDP-L-fucose synthase
VTRLLVTGGGGFLGRHVVAALERAGFPSPVVPRRGDVDLRVDRDVAALFAAHRFDAVVHLAASIGGIAFNLANPGAIFHDNVMMNTLVMEHARRAGVAKFVGVGSVCEYPEFPPLPMREESVWDGFPEPSNGAYGLSKRMMLAQGQAYRAQWNFGAVHLLMMNLYGPGDSFDPERSHAIPALIRRCLEAVDADRHEIVVWGDGLATREFLYVEDAARAIVLALARYHGAEPVNISTGQEVSIRDLALLIAELCGFTGEVKFDATKPSGQRRRAADVSRARERFGFEAEVGLRKGLEQTIEWYRQTRGTVRT